MSEIYKSEEGQRLVESRYRDLLTRWPVPSEQRSISTSFGDTFVVACGTPSMPPVILLRRECSDVAAGCRDAVCVVPCVLRGCDRRAGVQRTVTSTARCEHVRELAQGGARWTWPRAGVGNWRIAGRMTRAGLCDGGASARGSPRTRESFRNWPSKGQLRYQSAGTDGAGPMGSAQGRHAGSRPGSRQTGCHDA